MVICKFVSRKLAERRQRRIYEQLDGANTDVGEDMLGEVHIQPGFQEIRSLPNGSLLQENMDEDEQLRKAIEESKQQYEMEQNRMLMKIVSFVSELSRLKERRNFSLKPLLFGEHLHVRR